MKGVSQRHAELTVGPDGLRLEDLRSKNGSFVNGSRVTSAHLQPGDELWIATGGGLGHAAAGVWTLLDDRSGLDASLVWPLVVQEERVLLGTLGGGVRVLDLRDRSPEAPRVVPGRVILLGECGSTARDQQRGQDRKSNRRARHDVVPLSCSFCPRSHSRSSRRVAGVSSSTAG